MGNGFIRGPLRVHVCPRQTALIGCFEKAFHIEGMLRPAPALPPVTGYRLQVTGLNVPSVESLPHRRGVRP